MPAGTWTFMVLFRRTLPLPLQVVQGSLISLPLPPQVGQGLSDCMVMPMKFCWVRMVPRPPQREQVSGWVPALQPLPPQVEQGSMRPKVISFSQPKAASSKVISSSTPRFCPRVGPLRRWPLELVAPPKKSPKILPRSNPSKPENPPP